MPKGRLKQAAEETTPDADDVCGAEEFNDSTELAAQQWALPMPPPRVGDTRCVAAVSFDSRPADPFTVGVAHVDGS